MATHLIIHELFIIVLLILIAMIAYAFVSKNNKLSDQVHKVNSIPLTNVQSNNLSITPYIQIVFSEKEKNNPDLTEALADLYVNQRTFYYTGDLSSIETQKLSKKEENTVFIKYENVKWDHLQKIDI